MCQKFNLGGISALLQVLFIFDIIIKSKTHVNLYFIFLNINVVIAIIPLKASPITKCKMVKLKLSVLNGLITLFPSLSLD